MPARSIERDDESTSFDSRPWGGQQRLLPLGNRFARPADAPAPLEPVAVPASPGPSRVARGTAAPTVMMNAPALVYGAPPAMPSVIVAPQMAAPIAPMPAPVLVAAPAPVAPVYATVAMSAPTFAPAYVAPPVAVDASKRSSRSPSAVAAYSVMHSRPLHGYVVPHLPRVAEIFRSDDSTIAVRRKPLTTRSLIAAPVGALLGVLVVAVFYVIAPAPSAKPVVEAAATSAPTGEAHVMTMTVATPAAAPAAAVDLPAAPVAPVAVDAIADTPDASEASPAPSQRRSSTSSRNKKPRRIVAVDASTPLGNLRPR